MTADAYIHQVLDQLPRSLPTRDQIAMELRGHIAERMADGRSLDEVLKQLGDPGKLADSYVSAEGLVRAPFGARLGAKVIDLAPAVVIMFVPVYTLCRWLVPQAPLPSMIVPIVFGTFAFGCLLMTVYTMTVEYAFSQTIGKRVMGLTVVRESGRRIGLGQAIVRQLPFVLGVFWIDAFFALFTDKRQRAFELLSKTRTVSFNRPATTAPIHAVTLLA